MLVLVDDYQFSPVISALCVDSWNVLSLAEILADTRFVASDFKDQMWSNNRAIKICVKYPAGLLERSEPLKILRQIIFFCQRYIPVCLSQESIRQECETAFYECAI